MRRALLCFPRRGQTAGLGPGPCLYTVLASPCTGGPGVACFVWETEGAEAMPQASGR